MRLLLIILIAWIALDIPLGIFVGRYIHAGKGG